MLGMTALESLAILTRPPIGLRSNISFSNSSIDLVSLIALDMVSSLTRSCCQPSLAGGREARPW